MEIEVGSRKYRLLKLNEEVYSVLEKIREIEMEKARQQGNMEWLAALQIMSMGSFATWVLYKAIREIYKLETTSEVLGKPSVENK